MCRSVRWSRAPVVTLPLSAEFQSQLISSHRLRSRSVSQRIAVAIAMDLLGDIVERDTGADSGDQDLQCSESGFPELYKPKQISSWKQRLRAKAAKRAGADSARKTDVSAAKRVDATHAAPQERRAAPASAAQSIHEENVHTLQAMSPEAIAKERQELLESLDPKLIQKLLRNIDSRAKDEGQPSLFAEIEGAPGTWVGGSAAIRDMPHLSDEQVDRALGIQNTDGSRDTDSSEGPENGQDQDQDQVQDQGPRLQHLDEDDVAPLDFQAAQSIDHMANQQLFQDVHFIKPEERAEEPEPTLSLDDPDFENKLHDKYFPDLPRDVEKLKWMRQLPETEPADTVIEDVSQCRFDFDGNLVPPTREIKSTTHSALHHHADDPQLAGYTIPELQRLSRSTFAAQRAIALQTLGRILFKLGKQSYYQLVPEVDSETYQEEGSVQAVTNKIYAMFWDLCKDCRIVDCLQGAAGE